MQFHRKAEQEMNDLLKEEDRSRNKCANYNDDPENKPLMFSASNTVYHFNKAQKKEMEEHSFEVCDILARQRYMCIKKTQAGKYSLYLIDPAKQHPKKRQKREYLGTFPSLHSLYTALVS